MRSGFLVSGAMGPVALAAAGAAGNGLLNNLIAYLPLNEAGGANDALDLHSNALHLTQNGSPGSDAGKVYAAARVFDAGDDYFTRNDEALLSTGNVDFTVAAWVRFGTVPGAGTYRTVFSRNIAAGQRELVVYFDGDTGRFVVQVSSNGTAITSLVANTFGAPAGNTWYLVLLRHDAANDILGIEINGVADTVAYSSGIFDSTSPFRIGATAADAATNWLGRIGPVAMWKSAAGGGGALDAAKRSAVWNGGAGLAYAAFTT